MNGLAALLCGISLTACVPLTHQRAATSSLSCARLAVQDLRNRPLSDKEKHCLAGAAIARRCSVTEAYGAGVGKEIQDLLGPGDAEWGDLRADAAGVRCARASTNDAEVESCCAAASTR